MRALGCLAFLVVTGVAAGGCVGVKPYERELLAQPGMSLGPTPDVERAQHLLESREASMGGYGTSGGGCGCN